MFNTSVRFNHKEMIECFVAIVAIHSYLDNNESDVQTQCKLHESSEVASRGVRLVESRSMLCRCCDHQKDFGHGRECDDILCNGVSSVYFRLLTK
jgi:hypothetical protein